MSRFRIYPDKANTIASGEAFKYFNSSQNPVSDLWYGGGVQENNVYREHSVSRLILDFDLTELRNKFTTKELNSGYVTTYKLKLVNAVPSSKVLDKEFERNILHKQIASSFDLVAFHINKDFDEGRGYDLGEQSYLVKTTGDLSITGTSNWLSATTFVSWDEPGVYTNPTASTPYYTTQHFEFGGEDIDMDITNIVNNAISGGSNNCRIGVAYVNPIEARSATTRYISSFFTHKTNSAFKPFIEVQHHQVIKDDRHQVVNNRTSRLFLYLFSANTPTNYFSASTVSIKNSAGNDVYTGLVPVHHSQGVYYVDVWMSGTTKGQKYKDVWNGISFNPPYDQTDITQNFEIRDNYFTSNARDVNEYVITTYGIDNNATLQTDEVVRIYIDSRVNYSLNKPFIDYGLEFKLTMNDNIEMIPWTEVNSVIINGGLKSFVDVDTSWLLTNQTYQINFRIKDLGTKKVLSEKIQFRVVNKFK